VSSTRAKHWAWSQGDLSRSELLLLLAMADHVGETLLCYAALKNLATMARMSGRTAERTAERLVQAGKVEATVRPGQTTLFRLLVPVEFGKDAVGRARRRKPPKTPDKMTGAGGIEPASQQGRAPDMVSGVTPDKMTGVEPPPTICREPPSNRRGTPDKMSDYSSLNSSLDKTSSRTRASPASSPARAGPSSPDRELFLLTNTAKLLGISGRTQSESLADFRRRVDEAHGRELAHKAAAAAAIRAERAAKTEMATAETKGNYIHESLDHT